MVASLAGVPHSSRAVQAAARRCSASSSSSTAPSTTVSPGVLLSFEESADDITANVRSLGYDLEQLQADGLLLERVGLGGADVSTVEASFIDASTGRGSPLATCRSRRPWMARPHNSRTWVCADPPAPRCPWRCGAWPCSTWISGGQPQRHREAEPTGSTPPRRLTCPPVHPIRTISPALPPPQTGRALRYAKPPGATHRQGSGLGA